MPEEETTATFREMKWGELLKSLIAKNVRPNHPNGGGEPWTGKLLADAMGVTERQVSNWKSDSRCPNIEKLARKFAGSSNQSLFDDIVYVHNLEHNKFDFLEYLTNVSTVEGLWKQIEGECDISVAHASEIEARTISDIGWVISSLDQRVSKIDALAIARESRRQVYDLKYGDRSYENDERHTLGIRIWEAELNHLFCQLGIKSKTSKLLVVGIGCGLEGLGIYDNFYQLIGVDLSKSAIEKAEIAFPRATAMIRADAESLPESARGCDVYVSLKTFQSSFFDIEEAILQCFMSLKTKGWAIISVPRGYNKDYNFYEGLSRTTYNLESARKIGTYKLVDKMYPWYLKTKIIKELTRRRFGNIQSFSGASEHYVYAQKQ